MEKQDVIKKCRVCGETKPCAWNRRICPDCKGKKHPVACRGCGKTAMLSYGHKWCKDCRSVKWEGGFHYRVCVKCGQLKRMSGGRTRCRRCQQYNGKLINGEKLKRLAIDYLGSKCHYCGLQDECASVYDFHHRDVDAKEGNLSVMVFRKASCSITKPPTLTPDLIAELDKCDLVCSVCHRRLHAPNHDCCQRSLGRAKQREKTKDNAA